MHPKANEDREAAVDVGGGHVQRSVLCLLSAEITHVQHVSGVR